MPTFFALEGCGLKKRGAKQILGVEAVRNALKNAGGIHRVAAEMLAVDRKTIYNYIMRYQELSIYKQEDKRNIGLRHILRNLKKHSIDLYDSKIWQYSDSIERKKLLKIWNEMQSDPQFSDSDHV